MRNDFAAVFTANGASTLPLRFQESETQRRPKTSGQRLALVRIQTGLLDYDYDKLRSAFACRNQVYLVASIGCQQTLKAPSLRSGSGAPLRVADEKLDGLTPDFFCSLE
jgi:hypothetical protein